MRYRDYYTELYQMLMSAFLPLHGSHARQACEGTTLGVNEQFNACRCLKLIIKDQGDLFAMSEAKLEHCKILTLL